MRVAADRQRVGRGRDRPVAASARDLGAVDVQPQRRPVVGHRQIRPRVRRQRRRAVRSLAERAARRPAPPARSRRPLQVVVVVALVDHVPPGRGRPSPGSPTPPASSRRQMQRGRVGDRHPRLVPLNSSALPYLPDAVQVAFAIVPLLPLPDASATVVPDPHRTNTPPPARPPSPWSSCWPRSSSRSRFPAASVARTR